MNSRYHLANSAQVFVLSWVSVFAVTTPLVSGNVDIDHRIIHATSADLPTPCPEVVASRRAASGDNPSRMRVSSAACHGSGPLASASSEPGSPQGNENWTNPSGSRANPAS